ncbi:bifunctional helix-turn-helix transcriptional regulator/GNAT family N-acetyltransferase [Chelatococcus daeguensis]|uniref:bifunctional helix-turn-helix transcriptional regulator/GNAT family N-acetyltransferase n=1 Tax=Chelatococcus daeguensis TaxID=444444 RepID=UPI0032AE98B2
MTRPMTLNHPLANDQRNPRPVAVGAFQNGAETAHQRVTLEHLPGPFPFTYTHCKLPRPSLCCQKQPKWNIGNMQDAAIAAIRQFNRFHTKLVGALNEHLLASDYSLPQVRVLYEIANAPPAAPLSANDLAEALRLDPGYLSRLIGGLEAKGLILREPAPGNARRQELRLTETGRAEFARLDSASAAEVEALIAPLSERDRRELVGAMARIRQLLGDRTEDRFVVLRDPEPGDLGWIVHRQARLYAEEYGWDWTYEGLVAEIVGQFVKHFDPAGERAWVAERDGGIVGSIFVVREDDATARLRLLYVEPSARGLGLGRRLVEEALRFAGARGYRRMILWTNDVLVSARRIYEAAGFRLIDEKPHHSFGQDLVGQTWERAL